MTLHFAYGSNMSRPLMQRRCRTAEIIGTAQLPGWRFVIAGDGYASVVPERGAVVHGILWLLAARDLAALNAYESLDSGLYLRRQLPIRREGRTVSALVYVARNRRLGTARPGYQDGIVLPAARACELPAAYIAELERWC